jgi:hypothetical protein
MIESAGLDEVIEHLKTQCRVWLRVAAHRAEDDWQLSLLEVTLGAIPPGWGRTRWLYTRAVFLASAPAGRTVAGWLERGRMLLPPLSVPLDLPDGVHVERRPSQFNGIFQRLPWPTIEWNARPTGQPRQIPFEELVAADAPAFLSFEQAATTFFAVPTTPARNFSGREIVVREQDRQARIRTVRLRPTEVVARVDGKALNGTRLTLGGDQAPSRRLSSRTREIRLPVASGLAPGAWLALHRGQTLLDRRILDPTWGADEVERELDVSSHVELLINSGEGPTIEFKRELPGKDPRPVVKTVAAFANAAGGTILFGIDDDGRPVGLDEERTRESIDRLTSLITSRIRPPVHFVVHEVEVDRALLLLLEVAPGAEAPYGIGSSDRDLTYYVRVGATSYPASSAELRAVVRSRQPAEPPAGGLPRPRR